MALLTRKQTADPAPRVTLASAVLVRMSDVRKIPSQRDWQQQAWAYYDSVGELRFSATWMSNALSRVRLYAGIPDDQGEGDPEAVDPEDPETGDPRALLPLREFFGGPSGHGQALSRLAIHLAVPGESYLVGMDDPVTNTRRWLVASGEEFTAKDRKVTVRLPENDDQVELNLDQCTVIRLWRPHARRAWEADSPIRALLPVLKELLDLSAHITASVESRLAGAGILFLPSSATMPAADQQSAAGALHDNPIMAGLIEAMVTPIGDRDAASAVVPILVTIPEESQVKPQFMSFATPLDGKVQELRKDAIRRLATGLDMPPEILLGMGESSTNHWTAWQVDESSVKVHIAPLLSLICAALTERWYRPALRALAVPDADRYVIWFDASELTLRPNRTPEAQALHNMGLLAGDVTRRESGFSDDDAPDDDERKRWLLERLVLAGVAPEVAAPYLEQMGIHLNLPATPTTGADSGGAAEPTVDATPAGGRVEIPTTPGAPGTALPTAASLSVVDGWALAAVEMGVVRALEFAGKRMLNWAGRQYRSTIKCPPHEIHTQLPACDFDQDKLLEGAYSTMDVVFRGNAALRATVDGYVRSLLANQRRHSREALSLALTAAGCTAVLPGGAHAA